MDDNDHATMSPEEARAQARDAAVQRLGLISMAIWVVGIIGFMTVVYPHGAFKPSIGMIVGLWLFAIAAAPWVAYRPLVERLTRERAGQPSGQ